jgi:hypothetical protein
VASAMPRAAQKAVPGGLALDLAKMAEALRMIRGGLCPADALRPRT